MTEASGQPAADSSGDRWRLYFPKVELRVGVAALLAISLQVIAIYGPLGDNQFLRGTLMVYSYLVLFVFIFFNWKRVGILIIGAGLLMNFIPIAANGGLMPVTPETLEKTGPCPRGSEINHQVPNSKDILLEREDVRFHFLSDRLVWTNLSPTIRAFSLGDVVIIGGLAVTIGDLLLPRVKRSRQAPAPAATNAGGQPPG